ncbi:MAG: radical SAM protein [Proteobacteria bacterium]|nr:radical SAM protein [Pseudomonadota bacterium]
MENDELYELSEEAFAFLQRLPAKAGDSIDKEFLDYCLQEGIVSFTENPPVRVPSIQASPVPSLRYLELSITDRCNLTCSHCYLGASRSGDMPLSLITRTMEEFSLLQGLRLLITGGEPLLHREFWAINEQLRAYPFRSILLTNGTLITSEVAKRLQVQEVQVSLDGWEASHDRLRGNGSFRKAVKGIENIMSQGIRVSIATMVHAFNLNDFERLGKFFQGIGVSEWNVDVPCIAGRMAEHPDISLPPEKAGQYLKYGFSGGSHASSGNHVCGAHLCAVLPDGRVCKCAFFAEEPAGMAQKEGLRKCWSQIPRLGLNELRCDCEELMECRGGCRYRALLYQDIYAKDPVQCFARGFTP